MKCIGSSLFWQDFSTENRICKRSSLICNDDLSNIVQAGKPFVR